MEAPPTLFLQFRETSSCYLRPDGRRPSGKWRASHGRVDSVEIRYTWSLVGTPPDFTNGKKADPRSFCIQKTLQNIAHAGDDAAVLENNLMFSGHNAFRFAKDPFYSNGFIPTVKQLVERILTGR